MWLAVDSHYANDRVATAGIVFAAWTDAQPVAEYASMGSAPERYEPGKFYRRELVPTLDLIRQVAEPIVGVVVDGYVTLDPAGRPGLGQYVYDALDGELAVAGVAKSPFATATHALSVLRGKSKRPLLLTTVGIEAQVIARRLQAMHGGHRLPTLLKRVDTQCRNALMAS